MKENGRICSVLNELTVEEFLETYSDSIQDRMSELGYYVKDGLICIEQSCKLTFSGGVKMKVVVDLSDDEIKRLNELVYANIESDDDAAHAIHLVIELA